MFQKNSLSLMAAAAVGAVLGIAGTLTVAHFDGVRAWFQAPRWHYPELAKVKVEDCRIGGLPEALATYAISVDQGGLTTDLVVGTRALAATRGTDVTVSRRDKPVVLVLSAERSVVWNLSILKGVQLAAVLVLGREPQGLIGIPRSIPHLVITAKMKASACPDFGFKHAKLARSPEFEALSSVTESITGRRINFFQSAGVGQRFFAGPHKELEAANVMRSSELEADYLKADAVMPPGRDGLDWLVGRGQIRPAQGEDISAWIMGAVRADASFITKFRTMGRMRPNQTFVILDKIELPDHLRWDYSFILPEGIPDPDYANEAPIYRMGSFTCTPASWCTR